MSIVHNSVQYEIEKQRWKTSYITIELYHKEAAAPTSRVKVRDLAYCTTKRGAEAGPGDAAGARVAPAGGARAAAGLLRPPLEAEALVRPGGRRVEVEAWLRRRGDQRRILLLQ